MNYIDAKRLDRELARASAAGYRKEAAERAAKAAAAKPAHIPKPRKISFGAWFVRGAGLALGFCTVVSIFFALLVFAVVA